jgi:hypothetical protein
LQPEIASTNVEHKRKRGNPNWQKGVSGNPDGRVPGSRNKLTEDFLRALSEDFDTGGKQAIIDMRAKDPAAYVKAIVALCPKDITITNKMDELSDEQLDAAIRTARAILVAQGVGTGTRAEESAQPA